jgi:MarR family transcriptional regulator, organic hydroperoxide resistance regulator
MVELLTKENTRATTEYALDDSVGYMLSITDRRMTPYLKMCLSTEGISYGMWYFLRVLWEQDGLSQKELSYRTGFTQPTSVEAVRNMKKRGLIRITDDPNDARQMRIYLTQAGQKIKGKLLPKVAKINEIALAGISDAEFETTRNFLRKIRINLDGHSPEDLLID